MSAVGVHLRPLAERLWNSYRIWRRLFGRRRSAWLAIRMAWVLRK